MRVTSFALYVVCLLHAAKALSDVIGQYYLGYEQKQECFLSFVCKFYIHMWISPLFKIEIFLHLLDVESF